LHITGPRGPYDSNFSPMLDRVGPFNQRHSKKFSSGPELLLSIYPVTLGSYFQGLTHFSRHRKACEKALRDSLSLSFVGLRFDSDPRQRHLQVNSSLTI
jgi:hypothetical protein